jgi:MFS family permease
MVQASLNPQPRSHRFPALHVPHFRLYAAAALLSMAADNVEHVIGYWVIWQLTHSPFWLGYAVVAHWLPFTLFSFYSGSLADRSDCRRLIQISQGLYILASFGWGFLYLTGSLEIWHVAILLLIHGVAGLIFTPSSMLIIHEMVGEEKLVSAISLNAALRPIATTIGPAVAGLLMATVGPGWGFIANMFIYVPLSLAILYLPYRGATAKPTSQKGWSFIVEGVRTVRESPMIVAMLGVVAATSFLLGNAFQVLMPAFADRLEVAETGYSILLAANGMGAIIGGILLGWIGTTRLRPIMVTAAVLIWSVLLSIFSLSNVYLVSLALLCLVGVTQIIFVSMSQSIVQTWARPAVRGRVIGVYNFAAHGTRVLSGFVLGSLATLLGPSQALLLLAGLIGFAVLGISGVVRSLWHIEMKEDSVSQEKGAVAVAES